MATCTKCGKSNYEGVKYCTACGTPLPVQAESSVNEDVADKGETPEVKPAKSAPQKEEKTKRGMDPKMLYLIIGVVVLALIIFIVMKFFSGKSGQPEVDFNASKTEVLVDEEVIFTDNTKDANSWDWDFGDASQEVGVDQVVSHIFAMEGTYWVKLTVNGKYVDSLKILVTRKALPGDTRKDIKIEISGPLRVKVGQKAVYTDNTPDAKKWSWRMGESGDVDGEEQSITYMFTTPGKKEISVSNDIALKNGTLNIVVVAVPEGGGKAPAVSENVMLVKLQSIADGNMEKEFDKFVNSYLCKDPTVPVVCNGKNIPSFYLFCQDLSFQKGQKILKVETSKDPETNCITRLTVTTK